VNNKTQHIGFKLVTLILVIALLLPSLVKLHHAFQDHKHEVCINNIVEHFHELDLECEFYKFKLNTQFSVSFPSVEFVDSINNFKEIISQYHFISTYQKLHLNLRGPPVLMT
jgi:hypothetical protein